MIGYRKNGRHLYFKTNILSDIGVLRGKLLPFIVLTFLNIRYALIVNNYRDLPLSQQSQRRMLRQTYSEEMDNATTSLTKSNAADNPIKQNKHHTASESWRNKSQNANNTHTREKVIDILQIGSNSQSHLMIAQQQSFGSHVAIRHIFNATEDDDADQMCNSNVLKEDVMAISNFCRSGQQFDQKKHPLMQYMKNQYARSRWLEKKENPVGWLCAQKRPLHGLYKVFQMYRKNKLELPDHLIVMDDDTYYNMEEFLKQYVDDTPEQPLVRAGCLVRMPIHQLNFTFPFGGYGLVFNRPSLEVLMKPIYCDRDTEVCARIRDNQLGEEPVFQDGMALIDLMQAFASFQPFSDFIKDKWSTGYCLHSDW